MAKKTKLPFSMMPASWGLKGKSRAIAEAEYYYDGEELEEALAEIEAESDTDKHIARLDVQLKNGKIGKYEHEKQVAEIKEEPYVNVLKLDVNPENKWFNDVCRTVLIQEMQDQDYGLQQGETDVIRNDGDTGEDEISDPS